MNEYINPAARPTTAVLLCMVGSKVGGSVVSGWVYGSVGLPVLVMLLGRLALHRTMQLTLRRLPYSPASFAAHACYNCTTTAVPLYTHILRVQHCCSSTKVHIVFLSDVLV